LPQKKLNRKIREKEKKRKTKKEKKEIWKHEFKPLE
jgi:hypothetical protein